MITLSDFINEEINCHNYKLILEKIFEGKQRGMFKEEVIFNRYSVEIFFKNEVAIISDDIFYEEEELSIKLD